MPTHTSDPYAYKRDARLQARLAAEIQALLKLPGNSECADCGATRTVRFCSVTLGIFLCNRCYGIHRSVGAHITRTKCVGLDTWSPGEVEAMRAMGNTRSKALFEATVPADVARCTAASTDRETERWIRDKYERRLYYAAAPAPAAAPATVAPAPAAAAPSDWAAFETAFPSAPAASAASPAAAPPSDWAAFETAFPSAPAASAAPVGAVPWHACFETSAPSQPAAPCLDPVGAAPGASANVMFQDPFCPAAAGFAGGSNAPAGRGGGGSCLLD